MKIFIVACYLVALALQNVNACPLSCGLVGCLDENQKPGQIIDADGCLIWTCVPSQPLCCPKTSKDNVTCEAEWEPSLIMDEKTGCNVWTCAPKQPYCCPRTAPPTRLCAKGFHSFQVYDQKTGCLYWTCVPFCEVPPPATPCPNDTKIGHVYQPLYKCLNSACVPNQPTCCRQNSPDTIKCSSETEPGLVMDWDSGCKKWQCVPKQPYCCRATYPVEKCDFPMSNVKVYDEKTGCYVWECRTEMRRWMCDIPIGTVTLG